MIISHQHRYLFVELPHTGSTAISRELCANYGGEMILRKHALYREFLLSASPDEREYRVFSGIRNPLDEAVSLYFKFKTDHKSRFSEPAGKKSVTRRGLLKYHYIAENNADFATYLKEFFHVPYDNWSRTSHNRFDLVLRFEHLQESFAKMLEIIGVEQVRPLPQINRTSSKGSFVDHYTPDVVPLAVRIFGPFMNTWGYSFPPEWGDVSVPKSSQVLYEFLGRLRLFYWHYLRWNDTAHSRLFRQIFLDKGT